MSEPSSWHTLLGRHPATRALREGRVTSSSLALAFADVPVPNQAFKRVVRDLEFDVAEIALMTFLMARSRGVPIRLLPVVVFSRNPLPYLVCDRSRRELGPADLNRARIGVRSYTTTTAVWLRALLRDQLAVTFDRTVWTTIEEGHVAGVPEPANVRRDPAADLVGLLRDGALDAVIVDPVPTDSRFAPVVPNAEDVGAAWQARHQAVPVNHVICVRESLADDATAMRALFAMFSESRAIAGDAFDPRTAPIGLAANRRNLEVAIAAAAAQDLLAASLSVDDLVTDALASLG